MSTDRRRLPSSLAERVLLGAVAVAGSAVYGYALDPEREGEALVVELLVDGLPHEVLRADLFDATLAGEGARNPYHGFRFILPQHVFERASVAEVRLANDGTLIGDSLHLAGHGQSLAAALPAGCVTWLGGLRFTGWLASPAAAGTVLRGLVDGNAIAEARPDGWAAVPGHEMPLTVPTFDLELPPRFADGRVHRLEVVTSAGELLPPGPVAFVAFEDGLARFLARNSDVAAEQLRGELYDRLVPQSLPFDALEDWSRRFATPSGPSLPKPVAVVLIGEENLDASLDSLQEQRDLWIAGVMAWRGDRAEFDPDDLIAFLEAEAADCEVVVFAHGGTVFLPGALQRICQPLVEDTDAECAYGDVIGLHENGKRPTPLALPAFDRERTIEQGYAASFFALDREVALAAGRGGANSLFRVFLAGSGIGGAARRVPLHVPGFLARVPALLDGRAQAALSEAARHLCATLNIQATIDAVPAARLQPTIRLRRRPAPCLVSVIILVRNGASALRRCFAALKAQDSSSDLEFIVVDNDSSTADTAEALAEIASDGVQIVRVRGPRNVARSINCGAAIASGSYLCFIDQNVAVTTPDAIDELLSRCSTQATGAVGGLLTWPGSAIYDGGLVLNFRDGATSAFRGMATDEAGYADLLLCAREVSAVSGEFMMVGRDTFMAAGGMDEVVFPLVFPSVAFCLANAAIGHRTVFTPYARAAWYGPVDGGPRDAERGARFERELDQLRTAWPEALACDPFYSPLLNLDGRLHTGLAWPPRDMSARRPLSATRAPDATAGEPVDGPSRRRLLGDLR